MSLLHLEDTDPVPLVLAYLSQDERVQALLDGGHVTGIREAPWPCLVVESGPDAVMSGRGGIVRRGVSLVLYDSFEEAFGSWAARRVLLAVLQSLTALADSDEPQDPTLPVMCGLVTDASVYAMRTVAGQQRYMVDVTAVMTPAETPSTVDPVI